MSQNRNEATLQADSPLLTTFLRQLNISRRQLSLYPPEHQQIKDSVAKTIDILNELFLSRTHITIGIAPDALYFEQLWLDKSELSHRDFARFFFALGISSVSFRRGLSAAELTHFGQLMRKQGTPAASSADFTALLQQHGVEHITVIPIDYDAFQAGSSKTGGADQLWADFLSGLHQGVLAFGDPDNPEEVAAIADLLNREFCAPDRLSSTVSGSLSRFVDKQLNAGDSREARVTKKQFSTLFRQLHREARNTFVQGLLQGLEQQQQPAPLLQNIPASALGEALAGRNPQQIRISPRLFDMARQLAHSAPSERPQKGRREQESREIQRARLEVLFREERPEQYMPSQYQTTLAGIPEQAFTAALPAEQLRTLQQELASQSVEHNLTAILLEMLRYPLNGEQENAIQKQLLDLSRFFLDSGDFVQLRTIYRQWSRYLYSDQATSDIFTEQVLANHTQPSFINDVLDGFDIWDETFYPHIIDYIATVGECYSEPLIERLGLAPGWDERRRWMTALEALGGSANTRIVRALQDERWYLVRNLLVVLGKDLDPSTLKIIQQLSDHPAAQVRQEVIRLLFTCNPATANRLLLRELRSSAVESRHCALQIAHLSSDPAVLELLHRQLEQEPNNDAALAAAELAVQALARSGRRESLPILHRMLSRQGLLVSRRTRQLQQAIIRNLATFPGDSAEKLLRKFTTGRLKEEAETALNRRREESS
jgi:hypothetical protein